MRFIRFLMPREERFIEYFSAHAGCIVTAAAALQTMMRATSPEERDSCFKEVCRIEGEADAIARETMKALHRAFITPFDRSDIHDLSTALDDAVDLIEEVAQHAVLYRLSSFSPVMMEMGTMIEDAARLLVEAIPLLSNISRNAERINSLCERVGKIESEADHVLRRALSDLIAQDPPLIEFLGRKEVYELLETVTDRCDDVSDLMEGILLDHV
jgi:predicted phosphate transport protein (TIGR00153 family)